MAAPKIQYRTQCVLCKLELTREPFIPIVGNTTDPKIVEFVLKLYKHLQDKHPKQFNVVNSSVQQFMGFATVAEKFTVQDPVLLAIQEGIRAALHRMTRRHYITDDQIRDKIAALGFADQDAAGLQTLITDLRNILCEEGPYGPTVPNQPQTLVTP